MPDEPLTSKDLDHRQALDKLSKAEADAAKYRSLYKKSRDQLTEVTKQRDDFATGIQELDTDHKTALEKVTKERDTLQEWMTAEPSELQKTIDDLSGKLRLRDHRDAFNKLASAQNINPDALDDAWTLAAITVEGDAPDEKVLTEKLTALATSKPWLLKPAVDTASQAAVETASTAQGARPKIDLPVKTGVVSIVRGVAETTKPLTTVRAEMDALFAKSGRSDAAKI